MELQVNKRDAIENLSTGKIGIVTVSDPQWGWFRVSYFDGNEQQYSQNNMLSKNLRVLTKEEYADYLLDKENSGTTDYWRD